MNVTVAGVDKTTAFTITENNGNLTIACEDVISQGATVESEIVVTYNVILDTDAVIGTEGNSNKVYLEYSNDPNWNGTGTEPTGKTPEQEVKVYTWGIPVFKYTGTDTALAGAGFTLYKGETAISVVGVGNNIYKVCTLTNCEHTHITQIVTDDTGKFQIEGLEKGTYILKETKVPAGYNKCEDVTVVIGENGVLSADGSATTEVKIQNKSGSTLPETGGIGTTLFYVIGSILTLVAVVLLVTKKRMTTEK